MGQGRTPLPTRRDRRITLALVMAMLLAMVGFGAAAPASAIPTAPPSGPASILLTSPADGLTYDRIKPPLATYSCQAGKIPIRLCVGTDSWTGPTSTQKATLFSGYRFPALVGKHTFTVVAIDNDGNTVTATRSFNIGIGHRPDAIILNKGDNTYDDLATQTATFPRRRTPRYIPITIQNDGLAAERFRLKGDGTPYVTIKPSGGTRVVLPGWNVGYYEQGSCSTCPGRNITKWVVAGSYRTPALPRGGTQTIILSASPLSYAVAVNRTLVVSSLTDPASIDAVRATLR